jgi:hypothetical protein
MKKTLLIIAIAVATAAACSKEQLIHTETAVAEEVTLFTGSLNSTRISIGDKA